MLYCYFIRNIFCHVGAYVSLGRIEFVLASTRSAVDRISQNGRCWALHNVLDHFPLLQVDGVSVLSGKKCFECICDSLLLRRSHSNVIVVCRAVFMMGGL